MAPNLPGFVTHLSSRVRWAYVASFLPRLKLNHLDESVAGWSDLGPGQKLMMSLKILSDSFGVLMILVIISEVIN